MSIISKCKKGYSKIRSDFGMNKIDMKTLFFVIIMILLFIYFKNNKNQVINVENKIYLPSDSSKRRVDTLYIEKKCDSKKTNKHLLVQKNTPKKVNYSIEELKRMGVKTYSRCIISPYSISQLDPCGKNRHK